MAFLAHDILPPKKLDQQEPKSTPSCKRKKGNDLPLVLDLHGLTLDEAQRSIENNILSLKRGRHRVRIITGRGHHSPKGQGVLAREIHGFVMTRFSNKIASIDASPHEITLGGMPIKGSFDVVILIP